METDRTWQHYKRPILVALGTSVVVWVLLLLATVAFEQPGLRLQPPAPPVTVPFDAHLHTGSEDLPLESLSRQGGWWDPEQIHLALAGPDAVFVSWATHNASIVGSREDVQRPDLDSIASQVEWGIDAQHLRFTASGNRTSYVGNYPKAIYVSGVFHHVKLTGLAPRTTYFYRCGDASKAWSKVLNFTTPNPVGPTSFPQRIGVIGDLGQTYNSSSTLQHLEQTDPPVVWLVGDYTYSDNYTPYGKLANYSDPPPVGYHNSYQPRWDSWGRLVAPTFSHRPLQGLHGNHEIELDTSNKTFQAYTHRYVYPYNESASPSPHYYSFDIAGAHVLHLGSYVDFGAKSAQYKWLVKDLKKFSRTRTPWLIANFHAPWYHTYIAALHGLQFVSKPLLINSRAPMNRDLQQILLQHYKEANCHRLAVESLLYEAGVDLVFAGHVHAYSTTNKVYNYTLDECGLHHIVIGDGGNIERLYTKWVDTSPDHCPKASSIPCPTFEEGRFCPDRQPDWSAYREPSFGHGILELQSPTRAVWEWHRNQDGDAVVAHRVVVERNLECKNQQKQ